MVNIEAVERQLGITLLPHQKHQLRELYNDPYPIVTGLRQTGRSYLLAVHTAMSLLQPFEKNKIVVTGPCFRTVKEIFETVENIIKKANFGGSFMFVRESDRYVIKGEEYTCSSMPPASAYFLPLGNGEKARGLRANILLVDNEDQMPQDVLDTVYCGMAAVTANPIEKLKAKALGYKVYDNHQIVRVRSV